jgi:hypothetical protein
MEAQPMPKPLRKSKSRRRTSASRGRRARGLRAGAAPATPGPDAPSAPETPSAPDALVLYVHGIGAQPEPEDLKLEWDLALFGSDRGRGTHLAYWSDILHPPGGRRARSLPAGVDELSPEVVLRDAGVRRTARAVALIERLRESLDAAGGRAQVPRKAVMPLPGFMRRPISRAFLRAFLADVAAYLFDSDRRRQIRKRFAELLAPVPKNRPLTIVAHSLGSVVAIEVLAKLGRERPLTLVTIGSPLGLREVQDFLDLPPEEPPFDMPECIERWHNFSDPFDVVALDHGLRGEFVAREEVVVDPLSDEIVLNDRSRRPIGFNPHSAVGYLSHPKVRRAVHAAVQFDSMSRFVVARDVAEALGDDVRHPVLVEILEPGYGALEETPQALLEREERERKGEVRPLQLAERIDRAAEDILRLVRRTQEGARPRPGARRVQGEAADAARIDRLRRFVAAHLTPAEIRTIARDHREYNVYAVWRSAAKKKLIDRSRAVLQADAALQSYRASGAGIVWAVLDTGIQSAHPHFQDRILGIWDCTRKGPPVALAADRDKDGHGSHVAGIIAGTGSWKNREFAGIAPHARLMVYKVLNDKGEGEDAWIIKALDHIATYNENKAAIAIHGLNLSLGGPYDASVYGCGFSPICQELRRLWRAGVLVVVACGNEGQLEVQTGDGQLEINTPMSIGDPANLEDCIAVGSVNADRPHLYGISAFSSRGPTSDGRGKPDVVAPGERISSVNSLHPTSAGQPPYRADSGTSMAAPHVSGVLAAFLSVRREFRGRPDEVKRILLDTCTDIGRDRHHQGKGVPNLMKMLLSV